MLGGLGLTEILIILGLILIFFFGARKLPGIARALGKSITSFKKGYRGEDDDAQKKLEQEEDKKE
jgi:sec-independent protein translocase protein TatA